MTPTSEAISDSPVSEVDVPGPVVIIGAGLVGASVGCALTEAGVEVHLEDRNPSHATVAAGVGAGRLDPVDADMVGLVVAAVPPGALAEVIAAALTRFPHATVTDVGSVKGDVLDQLWRTGADRRRYVGSHPMAGSQHSGPVTARADLFLDRIWVVTPHRESAPDRVEAVAALVRLCRAREIRMDVDDHDTAVARVSHLPHLVSVLMAGHLTTVPEQQLRLAGQGLRDVTRIAGSDPGLWRDIVAGNAGALVPELKAVHSELGELIDAVESNPQHGADPFLARAVDGTRRIPGKHGQAPRAYATVVVEMPDQPGVLAKLFADAGAAGANVEDLAIEHDQVRQVGYLSIAVVAEAARDLAAAMRRSGWTATVLSSGTA